MAFEMNWIEIQNADDERLSAYRDLPDRVLKREDGRFICEGRWLVERLIESTYEVESILLADRQTPVAGLESLADQGVPIYVADKAMIEKSVGYKFHRGALAVSRRQPIKAVKDVWGQEVLGQTRVGIESQFKREAELWVVLVGVSDPDNVGAMMRAAAGLGASRVWLDQQTHDPFYRRALRAAMGTTLFLQLGDLGEAESGLRFFQQQGVKTVATVARPVGHLMGGHEVLPAWAAWSDSPDGANKRERECGGDSDDGGGVRDGIGVGGGGGGGGVSAIVLGAEGPGLSEAVVAACDQAVTIPMSHGTDSLNVGAAAAVLMYEWSRCHPKA